MSVATCMFISLETNISFMYVPTLYVHLKKYKISLWYGMDIFWNHPINNQNDQIDPTDQ